MEFLRDFREFGTFCPPWGVSPGGLARGEGPPVGFNGHSGGCMKTLGLGIGLIALVASSALLDAERGISIWQELRQTLAVSEARVSDLEEQNDALRREIALLEAEPTALDRAIREELGLVLPGEVVIYFTGAPAW